MASRYGAGRHRQTWHQATCPRCGGPAMRRRAGGDRLRYEAHLTGGEWCPGPPALWDGPPPRARESDPPQQALPLWTSAEEEGAR